MSSKKATKFEEIFTVKISSIFVAFLENTNFKHPASVFLVLKVYQ